MLDTFGQIVYEVRLRPNSFTIRDNTLGPLRHWPAHLRFDPAFETHQGLEWLSENSNDVELVAIHVREFGSRSGAFGRVNARVKRHPTNNLFVCNWTDERQHALREMREGSTKKEFVAQGKCTAYILSSDGRTVRGSAVVDKPPRHLGVDATNPFHVGIWLKDECPQKYLDQVRRIDTLQKLPEDVIRARKVEDKLGGFKSHPKTKLTQVATAPAAATASSQTGSQTVLSVPAGARIGAQLPAAVLQRPVVYNKPAAYLCIETALVSNVLRDGFRCRSRPNVAVECSPEDAVAAFKTWRAGEAGTVLTVLAGPAIVVFINDRGSCRVAGDFIPPQYLRA